MFYIFLTEYLGKKIGLYHRNELNITDGLLNYAVKSTINVIGIHSDVKNMKIKYKLMKNLNISINNDKVINKNINYIIPQGIMLSKEIINILNLNLNDFIEIKIANEVSESTTIQASAAIQQEEIQEIELKDEAKEEIQQEKKPRKKKL